MSKSPSYIHLPLKSVGIVDLGTNSVRFAIYTQATENQFICLHKKKIMLRPGQGVFSTGKLKSDVMSKIVLAFKRFAKKCQDYETQDILAYATSALREAQNADTLVRRVLKATQIEIKIISGLKEAQLIAQGINSFDQPPKKSVFLDIGGGSTEISWVQNYRISKSMSLNLGALRLQQLYLPKETQKQMGARLLGLSLMQRAIQKELIRLLPQKTSRTPIAIGSSGTIRALARLILATRTSQKKVKKNLRYQFTRSALRELVETMATMTPRELLLLPGMEKRRLDIIVTGAVLLLELMNHLKLDSIRTSSFGLRDGMLLAATEDQRY